MKRIDINNDKNYMRSTNYRYNFLKKNGGIRHKWKYYHCSYCGRICRKENIVIDHLIPVYKVSFGPHKKYWRKRLRSQGIANVNDIRNLVPACNRCNRKKGTKTGLWLLRGRIGQSFKFWCFYKPIKWFAIIILLFVVKKCYF